MTPTQRHWYIACIIGSGVWKVVGLGILIYTECFLPTIYLETIRGYPIILQTVQCVDSTNVLSTHTIPFTNLSKRTQPSPKNQSSIIANMMFVGDTYFGIKVTYNSTAPIIPAPPSRTILSNDTKTHTTVMYSVRFQNMETCVEEATALVQLHTWNRRFTYLFIQKNVNVYPFAYARTGLLYILNPLVVISLTIGLYLGSFGCILRRYYIDVSEETDST